MKLLVKGRKQTGWAKELVCSGKGNGDGGCGAKLLVEAGDLFRTESHCRDETDSYTSFRCSECKVITDIDCYPPGPRDLPLKNPSYWKDLDNGGPSRGDIR